MNKICNILDYGAVGDGVTLTTDAIQQAIDACQAGGEVIVPAGTFLIGDILLREGVTLHLLEGAVLLGSRDPMEYFHYRSLCEMDPDDISDAAWERASMAEGKKMGAKPRILTAGCRWNNAMIRAYMVSDVSVIGEPGSVIDGNDCYDPIGEEHYRGPHGMNFFGCRNITLRGYTIRNTGNWAHNTIQSENIRMEKVTTLAGHDGIHASLCQNISITECEFYTGDDAVAGFANTNVLVENCVLNSACSALRFGGTNVYVRNCHMYGPCRYCFRGSLTPEEKAASVPSTAGGHRMNMLSAFTYYADFSLPIRNQPGNIVIDSCRIDMADRFLHYNYSGNELWQKNRPLADITFRNITATGISMPITAYGSEEIPLHLHMENASIGIREGAPLTALIHAAGFAQIRLTDVKLTDFHGDCLVRTWSEGDVLTRNIDGPDIAVKKPADQPFFAQPI